MRVPVLRFVSVRLSFLPLANITAALDDCSPASHEDSTLGSNNTAQQQQQQHQLNGNTNNSSSVNNSNEDDDNNGPNNVALDNDDESSPKANAKSKRVEELYDIPVGKYVVISDLENKKKLTLRGCDYSILIFCLESF